MSTFLLRHNPTAAAAMLSSWFDRVLGDTQSSEGGHELAYRLQPRLDISEEEQQYNVIVDIPGMTKEDVSVKVENGTLRIEGERKEEKRGKYHHAERTSGKFLRSISLPEDVDSTKIEAKAANGVLELRLPKSKKAMPVEIKIA
jgi:HSP20 family protein